jgi:hypothetical protein
MRRTFVLSLSVYFLALMPALAQEPAAPAAPTVSHRVFDILRDGTKIGTQLIDIEKEGDATTVTIKTHISVVVLFVEAYRFEHSAVEKWQKGQFASFKSKTNANGTKHSVLAAVVHGKFDLTVNGEKTELPQVVLPATFWNTDFIGATKLLDTDKGTVLAVKVKDLGDESIELNGASSSIHAEHYKITGDLARDIWVANGAPVRITLLGSDNSKIVSDLRPDDLHPEDPHP